MAHRIGSAPRILPVLVILCSFSPAWCNELVADPAIEREDRDRIEKMLDQRGNFSYRKVSLKDFVDDINARYSLNLVLDDGNLREANIDPAVAEVTLASGTISGSPSGRRSRMLDEN